MSDLPTELLASTVHLARFLMAQHPCTAERAHAGSELLMNSNLAPSVWRVIEVVDPSLTEDAARYIVIDGTDVKTTLEPPQWSDPAEREQLIVPDSPDALMAVMRNKRSEFDACAASDAFPVDLDTLESYYPIRQPAGGGTHISLTLDELQLAEVVSSPEAAHAWCQETIEAVRRAYLSFRISGWEAASIVSFLAVVRESDIAETLLARRFAPSGAAHLQSDTQQQAINVEQNRGDTGAGTSHSAVPRYYSASLELDATLLEPAKRAARELIKLGDEDRDGLRQKYSIEVHYAGLCSALGWYLAADRVLATMGTAYTETESFEPHLSQVQKERVICEERRVVLLTALHAAADLNERIPDFWDGDQLWAFLHHLRAVAPDVARFTVRDYSLKLLMPRILADLALGWVDVAIDETADAGLARLNRLADELEQAQAKIIAYRFEPDYLRVTYECLCDGLARAGRSGQLDEVQRRSGEHLAMVAALNAAR